MKTKARVPTRLAVGLAAVLLSAAPCASLSQASPGFPAIDVEQPQGWDDDLRMAEPEDLNADPHILEFSLEASISNLEIVPGKATPAWTYNGTVPGPLIRAQVGDRLIVHFTNALPEATTIHWHGVRVPNAMDGSPGITQDPIRPGTTFTYDFVLKDAGTYWYHPHLNSPAQVAAGLYGAIVVEDPAEPDFGDDLVLVVSDIAIAVDGSLEPANRGGAFGDLFGREGDVLLINGKIKPTLKVRTGKQQRWRVVNAAITRYVPLALRDHRWTRIGGDGGLLERPERIPRIVLTPGERADLLFTPVSDPGTQREFAWLPVDRGLGTITGRGRIPMMTIQTVDAPPVRPLEVPEHLRTIKSVDINGATEKRVELNITIGAPVNRMMNINGVAHESLIEARVGETQVWNVVNNSDFDHPFHIHGYFFQVLDDTRIPEWKDTVNVPSHKSLRLAITFDDRPGMWMVHCHILDHAEAGMMGHLRVIGHSADAASAHMHP
jgi:FtsP/CotA-like multicopper oxidase with cupredoxin domain